VPMFLRHCRASALKLNTTHQPAALVLLSSSADPFLSPSENSARAEIALKQYRQHLEVTRVKTRIAELEVIIAEDVSSYHARLPEIRELHKLSEDLQRFESLVAELREVKELLQLIFTEEEEQNEEQDGSGCGAGVLNGANSDGALSSSSSSATSDLKLECEARINAVLVEVDNLNMVTIMQGAGEIPGCFVEVVAGAGGSDAQDWVSMLLRMYSGLCARKGWACETVDRVSGAAGDGVRNATLKIEGRHSFGWLQLETGIHRLVRSSPFHAKGQRHTSFAQVSVFGMGSAGKVASGVAEVLAGDLKVDTYRAQGAGGQHVNTTGKERQTAKALYCKFC